MVDVIEGFDRVFLGSIAISAASIVCLCRYIFMSDNFLHAVGFFPSSIHSFSVGLVSVFVLEADVIYILRLSSLATLVSRYIDKLL